ncbi:hypothetical protein SK128_021956 [Halocaridina rubra]|uniref:ZP domain-containing protein n=1 Tax=Halocaridina rubra TaxID=373956 RepID=A0AAN8XUD3_HALRR
MAKLEIYCILYFIIGVLALPNQHSHLPPFLEGPAGGGGGSNQIPVAAALQGQPGSGNLLLNPPQQHQQQGTSNPQGLPPSQQGQNPQPRQPPNPQTLQHQYRDQGVGSQPLALQPQQQGQGNPQQQGVSDQQRDQQNINEQARQQQQQRRHQEPQQPNVQVSGAQPLIFQANPQRLPNAVPTIIVSPATPSSPLIGAVSNNVQRRVQDTDVQCLKTHMLVTFRFSAPFNGFIYPHNQFNKCLLYRGDNSLEAVLQLRHGTCGDQENRITFKGKSFLDPVIEHRLMVQWERDIVSEDDSSVIVRCDRPDDYNKTVEWKLGTQEIAATLERAQHPGPKMWMEIQRGEGPSAPPLGNDPVYIGDVLTLVFVLTDNVFWFDSTIFSCHALDGGNELQQIEWDTSGSQSTNVGNPRRDYSGQTTVIENGCSVKPKLFSHFYKERNTMPNGDLVTLNYGHFKAFRFPTSLKLVLQCNVQVCYKECPEIPPCSEAFHPRKAAEQTRQRREAETNAVAKGAHEIDRVELFRTLEVLLQEEGGEKHIAVTAPVVSQALEEYCYSPTIYYSTVIGLVCFIVFLVIVVAIVCLKDRFHRSSLFTPTKCSQ